MLTEKPETHLVKSPELTDGKSFESGPVNVSGPRSDPVVSNVDSISRAGTERSKALTTNVNNEDHSYEPSGYSKSILKVPKNIAESKAHEASGHSKLAPYTPKNILKSE